MPKISEYPEVNSMGEGDYFLIDTTPITSNSTSKITKQNVLSGSTAPSITITVGQTGSGADFECDGTADDVQINDAILLASTSPYPATVEIIGYGYDFEYSISSTIIILPCNGAGVNIKGSNTVLKAANNLNDDIMRTENFYSEINTNYNSYSTIGNNYISGLIFEGNSGGQTSYTQLYSNEASFPVTGTTGLLYVDLAAEIGYFWNGSAYTTSGIANNGEHWRAYSRHSLKVYAYNYVVEDCEFNDAAEFAFYSEQTNTDTNIFNDYGTMEAHIRRVHIVGWTLGGINWLGPHDSHWSDVKCHTNQYATNAQYNIYVSDGANWNGGGLVWDDVHPWGNTASYATNVVLMNTSVRGNAYIEGSSNQGLYASGCSLQLDLVVTNNATNVQLYNCYNTDLKLYNYYQYNALGTVVKLTGSFTNSSIEVPFIDTTNIGAGAKVFDVSSLGSSSNVRLKARLPYNANLTAGVTATSLDATSSVDILQVRKNGNTTLGYHRAPHEPINVMNFGAVGDTQTYYGVTSSSSSPTVTITGSSPFTSNDVGKKVLVYTESGGNPGTITTISAVNSSTSITLAANAGITAGSGTGYITYGTDDSAAIQAALTYAGLSAADSNFSVSGFIDVIVPGNSPQSSYIIASALTVPEGVQLNTVGTLYNMLPSRNAYCLFFNPRSRGKLVSVNGLYGTGVWLGPSLTATNQYATIVVEDLRVTLTQGSSTTPTSLSVVGSTTGGTLAAATYKYVVTGIDSSGGESLISNEVSVTNTGSTSSNALTWTGDASFSSYRIYRGTAARGENRMYTSNTTSFTDTGAAIVASTEISPPGTAIHLNGHHFEITRIVVGTVTMGIYQAATDVMIEHADLIGCTTAWKGYGATNTTCPQLIMDTCGGTDNNGYVSEGGLVFDFNCYMVNIKGKAFQTFATTLSPVVSIGPYNAVVNGSMFIDIDANNVGGTVLAVANTTASVFNVIAENTVYGGFNSLPITTGVAFGSGNTGAININAQLASGITPYTGTYYAGYRYYQNSTTTFANGLAVIDEHGTGAGGTITMAKAKVNTGSNASIGTGTLSSGTVTISTTSVTASSLIFLTATSTSANSGVLSLGTITAGTSFVVNSSNASDANTFNWWIVN